MSGWRDCSLGDVLTLQRGFDLPNGSRRAGKVPVVSSAGITGVHDEAKVSAPGVVIGRYGTLGEVHYVQEDFWPLNTTLWVKDFKGNYPHFCAYMLETIGIAETSGSAAVPGVNRNVLHGLPVRLPPLETQRRIASILGAYDDLIEVNRRRIAVLEEMARGLFEEWFVRFRFPGHETVPILDTQDGPLPEGWTWDRIGDVAAYVNRGIAPKYDDEAETLVIGQKCIRDQRLSLVLARKQSKKVPAEKVVQPGDVLINSTGTGTLGRVAQAEQASPGLTVDSHVTIVRPNLPEDRDYLGLSLFAMQPVFEHLGAGSTNQTELARSTVQNQMLVWPPIIFRAHFGRIIRPMRELVEQLTQQNASLANSRDLLLPRLISGQLSVVEAERELEQAA